MQEIQHYFEWKTMLPAWSIALMVLAVLLWVYWCYKKESASASAWIKFGLAVIRLAILLSLLAILCEPVWYEVVEKTKKPTLVLMVDTSMSMKNRDHYAAPKDKEGMSQLLAGTSKTPGEITRIEVAQLLQRSLGLQKLKEDCEIKWYSFAEEYTPLGPDEAFNAIGRRTDIYSNLIKLVDTYHGDQSIAAVFILSDGQHNTSTHPGERERLMEQARLHLLQKETPVYTVGIGSSERKKDVVVRGIDAPEFALVDDKVCFEVELHHTNFPTGTSIPIYLKWGETSLADEMIKLEDSGTQKVSLFHSFSNPGEYNITVTIPPQEGEFNIENNSRQHTIKIIQQKFKILYLEDLPRWEYRYLKNALIRDTTVLANTWLCSADRDFLQDKSKEALPLGNMPGKDELAKFDCIVLGDVPPELLGSDLIASFLEFVQNGGGLIFIAGMRYNPKEYRGTALETLLPVQLKRLPEMADVYTQASQLRLTPEGIYHPILRLVNDPQDNQALWENLPGFYWYYPAEKPKPAATVLALHQESGEAIMATQMYGKGRTFFCGIDSTWRWRRPFQQDSLMMNPDRYFYRFWGQVIRYVAMGKWLGSGRQCFLRVDNSEYSLGDKVHVFLTIRDPQQAKTPEEVEIFYQEPGAEKKSKKLTASEIEPNSLETTFLATQLGKHKIWFMDQGKEISANFDVVASHAEAGDVHLNEKDLQEFAKKTQGQYIKPYEFDTFIQKADFRKLIQGRKVRIPESKSEYPYWDFWPFLTILIGFWTIEWIIRKIFRML